MATHTNTPTVSNMVPTAAPKTRSVLGAPSSGAPGQPGSAAPGGPTGLAGPSNAGVCGGPPGTQGPVGGPNGAQPGPTPVAPMANTAAVAGTSNAALAAGGINLNSSSSNNQDLASLFECPVCFDYVLPPIMQVRFQSSVQALAGISYYRNWLSHQFNCCFAFTCSVKLVT